MRGQMMDMPLTLTQVMRHAARYHGTRAVITASGEQARERSSYARVFERAARLRQALVALGCRAEDRIATLAFNHQRHLEIYYAVTCGGYVLHTINPRLFDEQLVYIINHAADRWLFVDTAFLPLLERLRPRLPHIEGYVVLGDGAQPPATDLPNAVAYESLLDAHPAHDAWPDLDERDACALCYTSGTTGDPKGVLYSHRALVLHALATSVPDATGFGANDVVMPLVPMFHVNAWGIPFRAPLLGAALVLTDRYMGTAPVVSDLINTERVTYAIGVPTLWQMLLDYLDRTDGSIRTLRRGIVGGSACPQGVFDRYRNRYGVELIQGWGMTETCSAGTVNVAGPTVTDARDAAFDLKQGRPIFGLELQITDDAHHPLPWDGTTTGHLRVRGPTVCDRYYGQTESAAPDGWFTTGDVARIESDGRIVLTDRSKDLIKSGGEWISSIELENCALMHPAIADAAVIAAEHPKWNERPLLVVVKKPGADVSRDALLQWFDGKVARWWTPDDVVFVDQLPRTATGKVSKLALRAQYRAFLVER